MARFEVESDPLVWLVVLFFYGFLYLSSDLPSIVLDAVPLLPAPKERFGLSLNAPKGEIDEYSVKFPM